MIGPISIITMRTAALPSFRCCRLWLVLIYCLSGLCFCLILYDLLNCIPVGFCSMVMFDLLGFFVRWLSSDLMNSVCAFLFESRRPNLPKRTEGFPALITPQAAAKSITEAGTQSNEAETRTARPAETSTAMQFPLLMKQRKEGRLFDVPAGSLRP
jgi:hypothetical protein